MDVEFEDIHMTVGSDLFPWKSGPKRQILRGVSGCFKSGHVSAILGPSGAGKSSLLNAVSGYRKAGVGGVVKVNGQPMAERKFRKVTSYITQEDLLMELLTVKELMMFGSYLKLPPSYTRKQRLTVVEEVLTLLGLFLHRNTSTECLSGGQRKRLSIALELINSPKILFLDEPTSGLDNVTASSLVKLLNSLARGNRTVVLTIHQPPASMLTLFDLVYFIGGGRCVYQGGTGPHMLTFLGEVKLVCPTHYNPADYFIELMEEDENIDNLSAVSKNGKKCWYSHGIIQETKPIDDNTKFFEHEQNYGERSWSAAFILFWIQFSTLFSRLMLQQKRDMVSVKIQTIHHVGCGIGIGLLYWNRANDGSEFFGRLKFCLGLMLFQVYTYVTIPILTYPFQVKLLKKEYFNKWYNLLPYYCAYTASRFPAMFILNMVFQMIIYYSFGLDWELQRFVTFCSIGIMSALVSEAMGLTIGALFSVTNGTAVGPLTWAPFLVFAAYGYDFARTVKPFVAALIRISFIRAGFLSLLLAIFGTDRGYLDCKDIYCHFSDSRVFIRSMNLENTTVFQNVLDLVLFLCFFRLAYYFALRWRLRR